MNRLEKLNNILAQIESKIEAIGSSGDLNENQTLTYNKLKESLGTKRYDIYHETYTSAVNEALDYATKNGYTYDQDEVATEIGLGPRKPDEGVTNRFSITLFKNGVQTKKMLHIQIYGMKRNYELNCYIN